MASEKINFKRNPWSGIFTEIAEEQGKTPQAIRQSWLRQNVQTMEMVRKKVEARRELTRFKEEIAG